MRFAPMLPPQTFQGLGRGWKGQRRPRAWDLNTPGGPQPLLLVQSPSSHQISSRLAAPGFLPVPACLETRDEKRDRGTERDGTRGQKWSDGGREQGKGKAPEGPWSEAVCALFWPRGRELHRAGSYTLPRWCFNFLGARPSLSVPAGSSGCVSKGCCACHVTVSSGRWLLI